jgi:hypothetical protein
MKMNTRSIVGRREHSSRENHFGKACLDSCKEALGRLNQVKEAILAEARETLQAQEQLVRLALNEAEALARQTLYPHLVFPDLAAEKVQAIATWQNRQRRLSGLPRPAAA